MSLILDALKRERGDAGRTSRRTARAPTRTPIPFSRRSAIGASPRARRPPGQTLLVYGAAAIAIGFVGLSLLIFLLAPPAPSRSAAPVAHGGRAPGAVASAPSRGPSRRRRPWPRRRRAAEPRAAASASATAAGSAPAAPPAQPAAPAAHRTRGRRPSRRPPQVSASPAAVAPCRRRRTGTATHRSTGAPYNAAPRRAAGARHRAPPVTRAAVPAPPPAPPPAPAPVVASARASESLRAGALLPADRRLRQRARAVPRAARTERHERRSPQQPRTAVPGSRATR